MQVFERVEEERTSGYLSGKVTRARVSYEADSEIPGLLIRTNKDGSRDKGQFKNGSFLRVKAK